jgi:Protein O-mannosyl-transferase TMEM260-like
MTSKSKNLITASTLLIITLAIYLKTLAPTVWFIDSGELSAVASTLGIAHPTGYPLFTLVGHLFSMLPISTSQVYNLNLMSAFFCSLAIFMYSLLMKFILQWSQQEKFPEKGRKAPSAKTIEKYTVSPLIEYAVIVFSALILAFSRTFWDSANSVEVYPIHVFFIITLMFLLLKSIQEKYSVGTSFLYSNKYYLLFAFVLGLSFTNHLTTLLLAPACLVLFFVENSKDRKRMLKLLGAMAVCFIIGLTPYLYLPIRARMHPIFIWGNPYNWERFYWHVTGKQFSIWIFSAQGSIPLFILLLLVLIVLSVIGLTRKTLSKNYHPASFIIIAVITYIFLSSANEVVSKQFKTFTDSLWSEYGKGLILFAIPGIYRLSRFNIKIFYFTVLAFFGCILYSVNYDIHDIFSYFLLAYVTIAIWIAFGGLFLYEKLITNLKSNSYKIVYSLFLVVLSLIALNTNYKENNESNNYYVEQFTMNIFKNVEPNGIVISSQWDFWVSASWYFHFVKNVRSDIVVIDKELLRRSWYFIFLERNYPEIYNNSKPEIEKFLGELYKFEHNIPYDTKYIMKLFGDMLTSFVTKNPERKVYDTWEIEQNKNEPFATNYARLPDGLLFRLVNPDSLQNKSLHDYKIYDFTFTPTDKNDYYHQTLMLSYASMLTGSANYLVSVNRFDDAKKYLNLALTAVPNYPQALEVKRKFNL